MLNAMSTNLGTGGLLAVALLGTLTLLAWLPAVAAVAGGEQPWRKRLPLLSLLVVLPPSALLLLGLHVWRERREELRLNALERRHEGASPLQSLRGSSQNGPSRVAA